MIITGTTVVLHNGPRKNTLRLGRGGGVQQSVRDPPCLISPETRPLELKRVQRLLHSDFMLETSLVIELSQVLSKARAQV